MRARQKIALPSVSRPGTGPHALPFVDLSLQTNPEDHEDWHCKHWTLPAEGLSYIDGCEAGKWAAHAYVKYLREREAPATPMLQLVALGLARRLQTCSQSERNALHGQLVGFFSEIERTLIAGADWGSFCTNQEIAQHLADAARGEPLKRYHAERAAQRSADARRAARARWARARETRKATKPTGQRLPR